VHQQFPAYFAGCTALDVHTADIKAHNRHYFDGGAYHTVTAGKLTFANNFFDTIVSSECFEHDMHYVELLRNIMRVLKPGGRRLLRAVPLPFRATAPSLPQQHPPPTTMPPTIPDTPTPTSVHARLGLTGDLPNTSRRHQTHVSELKLGSRYIVKGSNGLT
jgi:ubiquinone/menaquinone biosynthesis C-methylase UbiE